MAKIKICIILLLALASCEAFNQKAISARFREDIKTQEAIFSKYNDCEGLFDVFPYSIVSEKCSWFSSSPSNRDDGIHCTQHGFFALKCDTKNIEEQVEIIESSPNIYKTSYFADSSCYIHLNKTTKALDTTLRYNVIKEGNIPIPCFERNYIFSDSIVQKTDLIIENTTYYPSLNYVPNDLIVYVTKAEAGNFGKFDSEEHRPESLKAWKHGYSCGFATSEQENIVVYWTMVW